MHLLDAVIAPGRLEALLAAYGILAVFAFTLLESAGLPLPGEAVLLAAAAYAGQTHALSLPGIVAAAAAGAVAGDNLGYAVGRGLGLPLLRRYGARVGASPARLRLGRYLFARYGGRVVFFGRFVAVLRAFAALLAGVNRFPWQRFALFNAAGGVAWASLYGAGAYLFGSALHRVAGPLGLMLGALAAAALVAGGLALRRRAAELQAAADAAGDA